MFLNVFIYIIYCFGKCLTIWSFGHLFLILNHCEAAPSDERRTFSDVVQRSDMGARSCCQQNRPQGAVIGPAVGRLEQRVCVPFRVLRGRDGRRAHHPHHPDDRGAIRVV